GGGVPVEDRSAVGIPPGDPLDPPVMAEEELGGRIVRDGTEPSLVGRRAPPAEEEGAGNCPQQEGTEGDRLDPSGRPPKEEPVNRRAPQDGGEGQELQGERPAERDSGHDRE